MQSQSTFSILQTYFDWFCSFIVAAGHPIQKHWRFCHFGNRATPTRHAQRSCSQAVFLTITSLLLDAGTIYCYNVSIFELLFRSSQIGLYQMFVWSVLAASWFVFQMCFVFSLYIGYFTMFTCLFPQKSGIFNSDSSHLK